MRIIFIGQAAFGKDALNALIQQDETIVGVLTIPDKAGQVNPVKELAENRNIPVLQPSKLKNPEAIGWVKDLQPELLVLAFVTDFVPKEMIQLSTSGGINFHPSLLPKYRGGSAINWTIICGETETGVTIHQIDDGVDTGPIILQEKVTIDPDDTVKSLYFEKLYPLGIKMVAESARMIREGKAKPVPQDVSQASYQPIIKEKDVIVEWTQPTQKLYDLIRGSNPTPGATTYFQGEKLKIWEGKPYPMKGQAGEVLKIIDDQGFVVATGDGAILAQRIQYKDTEKINAVEFLDKYPLKVGTRLSA